MWRTVSFWSPSINNLETADLSAIIQLDVDLAKFLVQGKTTNTGAIKVERVYNYLNISRVTLIAMCYMTDSKS
jgi:hypothetical protein